MGFIDPNTTGPQSRWCQVEPMPQLYRAAWVLPIASPPQRHGWVIIDDGVVIGVGTGEPPGTGVTPEAVDLGDAAILPGLLNAHTHLELAWMRNRVAPGRSMPEWAARLMALRRTVSHEPSAPIADAVREVRAAGTSLVGDVSNTLAAYDLLADGELGG